MLHIYPYWYLVNRVCTVSRHRFWGPGRPVLIFVVLFLLVVFAPFVTAQEPTPQPVDGPPFSLPFADPPGPDTWLYEQHYGNTTSAFNYGDVWYSLGQGLHFGIDFEAACGTPVRAIADGIVTYVDAAGFGAEPHNLVLVHPGTGYTSLYGHLLEAPDLVRGQSVRRGEVIALSGDPDGSCESRPHLHLEIRDSGYQTAYNPIDFFDVNWHMLTSIGLFTNIFQQDLDTPYRWMRLEDQPPISFAGDILNRYLHPWPPKLELRAPINPPVRRSLDPLPAAGEGDVQVTRAPVVVNQWNTGVWWNPADLDAVYLIDAVPGQSSGVFRQPLDGSPRVYVQPTPPALLSPGGDVSVQSVGGGDFVITRLSDGQSWTVFTNGNYPAVSPDGTRLLWEVVYGEIVPGQGEPSVEMWVSGLDGSDRRRVHSQSGGWSMWLDDHRLLLYHQQPYRADTTLSILDIDADQDAPVLLGTYRYLRGLQVAPGGEYVAFFLPFQSDAADNGVYVLATRPGSEARQLDGFGAYRWRDDDSLYMLSFDGSQDAHILSYVDVYTGRTRPLTNLDSLPIRVANGDWSVSPDGSRIVYVDPTDYGLYLLTIQAE